jgi:primosomal protein N''
MDIKDLLANNEYLKEEVVVKKIKNQKTAPKKPVNNITDSEVEQDSAEKILEKPKSRNFYKKKITKKKVQNPTIAEGVSSTKV